ncbi:MAG TPA: peptide deformylase [Planctomycetota bacterium]|nr:peptide deformylase [Planctomycetota bacterium]
MKIVLFPDPVLRRGTKAVEDTSGWKERAREMLDLMYETQGVGLAAPQVGISEAVLVLNPSGDKDKPDEELVLVNPRIVSKKGKEWGAEGCLSFPGIYGEVQRAIKIVVHAQALDGAPIEFVAEEFLARVIQHEMDHLAGIVFTDRFSPADKIRTRNQLEELEERWRSEHAAR